MIRIKGRALTYGELWYDEEPENSSPVDVLTYRHRPSPVQHRPCRPVLTLISDITVGEDQILARFASNTRYEIKRADRKDGLSAAVVPTTSQTIASFVAFYDAFAREKALEPAYRRGLLASEAAQKLVLTTAARADELLVWHAYIISRNTAVLLYSASHFRHKAKSEHALVGRANRWLHWRDIAHFKSAGIERYDWGGMFQDERSVERAGINGFKYDFGGTRVTVYNCTLPLTVKGRLYLATRALFERVQRS